MKNGAGRGVRSARAKARDTSLVARFKCIGRIDTEEKKTTRDPKWYVTVFKKNGCDFKKVNI